MSVYVQFGCGWSAPAGWLNFDASPTLRIERIAFVGRTLGRLAGNASPFPKWVRYGDITKGLPIPSGHVTGLYASHVLEHLALEDMRVALSECIRLLRPGGVFRLIVPDLKARAEAYLRNSSVDASHGFMRDCYLGEERRQSGLLGQIRALVGNSRHLWMWDESSMRAELETAGFVGVRQVEMGDSEDEMFRLVEDPARFHDGCYRELAMEARRPE